MKAVRLFTILGLIITILSCTENDTQIPYPTIDYLTVRKKLDTLNADQNAHGYQPTVTLLTNGRKQLVFFGTAHVRTVDHPQFKALETAFLAQKPQITFNEGGQLTKRFSSREQAIEANGETGLLRYLSDQQGVAMMDGDMTTRDEFKSLLERFPNEQVYLYMAIERFLNPYHQGYHTELSYDRAFQQEYVDYLEQNGFPLTPEQKTTAYLGTLYKKYLGQPLALDHLVDVHEAYLNDTGIFGEIGRASKEIRDQALLTKIDNALSNQDRVFIVFGASHWVAVQPALQYIINKRRP